jgi:HlyD family secretion protein
MKPRACPFNFLDTFGQRNGKSVRLPFNMNFGKAGTGFLLFLVCVASSCNTRGVPEAQAAAVAPAPVATVPNTDSAPRIVRSTGTTQALKSLSVRVPQISGQSSRVTLVNLIPNGSKVKKGDILVEFDQIQLLDDERDAVAKIKDFTHQIEERAAKARSDATKRVQQIKEAEADLARAEIQLRKGPILGEIDRLKNEVKAESARARVGSLTKSHALHTVEEKAAVRVLELKRDRQQVTLDRIRNNMEKLTIKAPQDGMVALENVWRNGSQGPPQEGDQLYPGQPVLRIFDPSYMVIDAMINEPDFAALAEGATAKVYLDAYPNAVFQARLEYASPIATAGLDSPVRTFSARFRVAEQDPRLLPDLSASLEITFQPVTTSANAGKQK